MDLSHLSLLHQILFAFHRHMLRSPTLLSAAVVIIGILETAVHLHCKAQRMLIPARECIQLFSPYQQQLAAAEWRNLKEIASAGIQPKRK